jgi:hypothetical protein
MTLVVFAEKALPHDPRISVAVARSRAAGRNWCRPARGLNPVHPLSQCRFAPKGTEVLRCRVTRMAKGVYSKIRFL